MEAPEWSCNRLEWVQMSIPPSWTVRGRSCRPPPAMKAPHVRRSRSHAWITRHGALSAVAMPARIRPTLSPWRFRLRPCRPPLTAILPLRRQTILTRLLMPRPVPLIPGQRPANITDRRWLLRPRVECSGPLTSVLVAAHAALLVHPPRSASAAAASSRIGPKCSSSGFMCRR